jgi:DegV family protein with EDD domain
MTIRIATDSTGDLPVELAQQYGIAIVPCYITIGNQSFLDGVDLSRQEFYARLPHYSTFPTTAAPGIEIFTQTYEQLVAEGATEIIAIHLSSTLSAVFSVAQVAAQEIKRARVTVFDSRQLSLGTGWQAVQAAQMAQAGATVPQILATLREQITRIRSYGVMDTLEYLRRGGRISWLLAGVGTALQIKPVFCVYDGKVTLEKTRTRKGALERLMQLISAAGTPHQMAVVYTDCPDRAEELRQLIQQHFPAVPIEMCLQVTPIIGAHLGPGAVGVVCIMERTCEN